MLEGVRELLAVKSEMLREGEAPAKPPYLRENGSAGASPSQFPDTLNYAGNGDST